MTSHVDDGEDSELGDMPIFNIEASPASSMEKQIEAFAHLAEESSRVYNIESLHTALEYLIECPFIGTPRKVTPNRSPAGATTRRSDDALPQNSSGVTLPISSRSNDETENEIGNVSSISHMRALLNKWRRKCGKTRSETEYVSRLERFFRELQYQRRLARYFVQRIYAPLYKKFFDVSVLTVLPDDLTTNDGGDSGINIPTSGGEEDSESPGFFLTECAIPEESLPTDQKPSSMPERFEDVVHKLTLLHERWRYLLREDNAFSEDVFESSSALKTESFTSNISNPNLRFALRLLPDLFDKCSLAATLALEWLGISEDLSLSAKQSKEDRKTEANTEQLLKSLRKDLLKKESDIRRGEHSLNIYEQELKQLSEREERVLALCDNCEQLEVHRERVGEEYQQKVESRVKMVEELENTIQGSQRYRDLAGKLKSMELEINNQYGELKLVEYALNIAANDFDLHMSVQPSFYAYSRTTRDKIERTKSDLGRFREEKERLQRRYDRVRDQMEQMRLVVEQADPKPTRQKEETRPATNETYTRFRIDDRYSDKGQASDNSAASGTDGETESGHEADAETSVRPQRPGRVTGLEAGHPRARTTAFPVWPIHSGPGKLVNHSAPLSQE